MIQYEVEENIGILTIQNPPVNALSLKMIAELEKHFSNIKQQEKIKVIIMKGASHLFCGGADVKDFTALQQTADYQSLAERGQQLFDYMEHFHIPIIAAIHGAALGGGLELAMACHIRYVTEDAKMGLPELSLGIIPGFAGTQRLPQFVGTAKAYELILSGKVISGKEAYSLGLANQVYNEEDLFSKVNELAQSIAEKSKPTITKVMDLIPYAKPEKFKEGANAEAIAFSETFGSVDAREGVSAFVEKRKPIFQDK